MQKRREEGPCISSIMPLIGRNTVFKRVCMWWMVLLLTIALLAFCVLGLGVRILFKKNGRFSHRCAMSDLDEGHGCGHCPSAGRHEDCPNFQLHHGNTANRAAKALELADEGAQ